MNKPHSHYIGLMSGTSLDGIDAVLAQIDANGKSSVLEAVSTGFDDPLRKILSDLQNPGHNEIHRENQAANLLSLAYATCVQQLLQKAELSPAQISAIGAHGQTIRHQPGFGDLAYTHQTLNPALLAEETGIDVIADFRSRDMAAGGHGAPLVPAFHDQQFGASNEDRAALNLGGIANLTLLPMQGEVRGFDCGPGNMLMDAWIAEQQGHAYDANGNWALQGSVHPKLLERMLADSFFAKQPPKSTGRDDFHLEWLRNNIGDENIEPEDVQATLLHLTAISALQALASYAPKTKPAKM